jgi:hypothetical protein
MSHRTLVLLLWLSVVSPAAGAELAVLSNENWDRLAPAGKEADAILGDLALRSDRLQVVIGQPLPGRNANLTVRQVGGAVIDLTVVERPNDQLGAFYPGMRRHLFNKAEILQAKGKKVVVALTAPARPADDKTKTAPQPEVRLHYELEDGQSFLIVRSVFRNTFNRPLEVALEDDLRADNFDNKVKAGPTDLFWVHDHYFEQAYGLVADKHLMRSRSDIKNSVIEYIPEKTEAARVVLAPGQTHELVRRLTAGADLLAVKGEALRLRGQPVHSCGWHLVDPAFRPVAGADVTIRQGETVYGTARSDAWGWVRAELPPQKFTLTVKSHGRGTLQRDIDLTAAVKGALNTEYQMDAASVVVAEITDDKGGPVPCKVAFKGIGGTTSPNWGPPSARQAVVNLCYSENGRFTVPINPGSYEVLISRGPAYHVTRVNLQVEQGRPALLKATLRRAFATPGWVSTDFHSHSSPSGDNTSDQRGRVLNLLAEHIEFAPCTEHNRLDSYLPHLKALGAEKLMGTCTGIELTGTPLPLNHHNAFPLKLHPRTQDGGAPQTDPEPEKQLRTLYEWDGGAEKLVQQNHPDIGWLFFDRDGDDRLDSGYRDGFPFMHVIEVHPISEVLAMEPTRLGTDAKGKKFLWNNPVFNWLQLLNLGFRIPGVVNTDAHYNFHGSGGLRNYVRGDAKAPGEIDPLEIVRHCKKGHIVMSTGPFLEVRLNDALPGDALVLTSGIARLQVKVLCPNWFDVDRVQVLLNGRPDPALNFTRKTHPQLFGKDAVRFAHGIDLVLSQDTHVIVVAVGEEAPLGEVMGPMWGRHFPTAISNPIWVDRNGDGFRHNGDLLGGPLPFKGNKPVP